MVPKKVSTISMMEVPTCQKGTSVMAIRVIIRIGEKKGIMDAMTERVESGASIILKRIK